MPRSQASRAASQRRTFRQAMVKRETPRILMWMGVIVLATSLLNEAVPPTTYPPQLLASVATGLLMLWVSRTLARPSVAAAAVPWAFGACVCAFVLLQAGIYVMNPVEANLAFVIIATTAFGPLVLSWRAFLGLAPVMLASVVGALAATRQPDLVGWASGLLTSLVVGAIMLRLRLHGISELADSHVKLAATGDRFRLLAEHASGFVLLATPDGVTSWVSPSVAGLLGWRPDQLVGRPVTDILPCSRGTDMEELAERAGEGESPSTRVQAVCPDGTTRWLTVTLRLARNDSGCVESRVLALHDAQQEIAAEQALAQGERQFRLALESAAAGMAVVRLDRSFVAVNRALCQLTDRSEEWLLSHRVPDILHPEEDAVDQQMRDCALSGLEDPATREERLITAKRRIIYVEHSVGVLRDDDGKPLSFISQFVDVTAQRMSGRSLLFRASHDPLTGLANRDDLVARISDVLIQSADSVPALGVLFADLDGLKAINDVHGHAIGDQAIKHVGAVLRKRTRRGDTVARISGDEFVVALVGLGSPENAATVAGKILAGLAEVPAAVTDDGTALYVSMSIGAAVARAGESAAELIGRADRAMYRAKRSGRNRVVVFDDTIDASPAEAAAS